MADYARNIRQVVVQYMNVPFQNLGQSIDRAVLELRPIFAGDAQGPASFKGCDGRMNVSPSLVPTRLLLPEVVELVASHLKCNDARVRELLERAVQDRTLRDIESQYPDGMEIETDVTTWQEIDWEQGIVMMEPSWGGSPAVKLPIYPLFNLKEVCRHFNFAIKHDASPAERPVGRPAKYDWDAFWVAVCMQVKEEGWPKSQAILVRRMENWFMDRGEGNIDPRTIEKKLAKLFDAIKQSQ